MAALGGIGAYEALRLAHQEDYVPWPQRRVLELNGKLWRSYVDDAHLMPTYSLSQVRYLKPNGEYGIYDDSDGKPLELDLQVEPGAGIEPLGLSLADVQALPKHDLITRFCCIEGWSSVAHWGGARFSDFTKKYFPKGMPLPNYVYMATEGGEYFVGLDMKSALHPQTLLAWEKDGQSSENRSWRAFAAGYTGEVRYQEHQEHFTDTLYGHET